VLELDVEAVYAENVAVDEIGGNVGACDRLRLKGLK